MSASAICKFWKGCQNTPAPSAKVVDGSLILSSPDAVTPVVWRMDLGSVKASAMEVRDHEGHFHLTLKTPKGETHDIAKFKERDNAIKALMRVSAALEKAEGRMAAAGSAKDGTFQTLATPARKSFSFGKAFLGFVFLLALLLIASYWMSPSIEPGRMPAAPSLTGQAPPVENGVPMSADDYLQSF